MNTTGILRRILSHFETGIPMIDYMIFAALASAATYVFNWLSENMNIKSTLRYIYYHYFTCKNIVSYEGKISTNFDRYSSRMCQTSVFSEHFRALWDYIIRNVDTNTTIREIKEYVISDKTTSVAHDKNMYIVNQLNRFLISEKHDIYAVTYLYNNSQNDGNDNSQTSTKTSGAKTEYIVIDLFSSKSSIQEIKAFVEDITRDYLAKITHLRENQQFIYSLSKLTWDDSSCEMWKETVFESTRTFKNLFFERSDAVIGKVDFFLKNRDWYYDKGIPYTLGIGLYGPPGTGKTSFIKALANHTGRHIVSISLKMIKTKKQLEDVFFESRYDTDNKKGSIGFDKKIIVFEDIDCIGDIVMDRAKKQENKKQEMFSVPPNGAHGISASGAFHEQVPLTAEQSKDALKMLLAPDDAITLDDILELWDGIREASGRIMIVTSNHYDKLDPALKRPGRIDITLELAYASREIIGRMYKHLVGEEPDINDLEQINDRFYTPAEITNAYMNERRGMLKLLMKNEQRCSK